MTREAGDWVSTPAVFVGMLHTPGVLRAHILGKGWSSFHDVLIDITILGGISHFEAHRMDIVSEQLLDPGMYVQFMCI